jgi:hypothetical protein
MNPSGVSYPTAVAYQGGQVNTPQQEPKTGQTQPREAPAADTQRGDQRSHAAEDTKSNTQVQAREKTQDAKHSPDAPKNTEQSRARVDVTV